MTDIFTNFTGAFTIGSSPIAATTGSFTISSTGGSSILKYSAVPEPTNVLAGLLLGAGLLRRRRSSPKSER